jgi:hypothetical protein
MCKNHTKDKMSYANDAVVALGQVELSAPTAILRNGLPNSSAKFLREKSGRVAFLGGSITQMNGWSKLIEEDLRSRFPETEFQFNNAGIDGTNSTFGVFRFDDDVLAKGPVNLLFIEFAVNDASDYGLANQRMQAMEGIIRKARQANPATVANLSRWGMPNMLTAPRSSSMRRGRTLPHPAKSNTTHCQGLCVKIIWPQLA